MLVIFVLFLSGTLASYDISDKIIFPNLPSAAPRSENKICREESQMYIENLNNLTLWAHKMWDATAKSTTGVLQGSIFHFGNWDECMKVDGPFRTQYCFAIIRANVPEVHKPSDEFSLTFRATDIVFKRIYHTQDISKQSRNVAQIGWCVPASCTSVDLEKSLSQYLSKIEHPFYEQNVSYLASVTSNTCQRENEIHIIDSVDIGFCLLTALLILLVIIGTVYDVKSLNEEEGVEKEKKKINRSLNYNLCVSFSARRSIKDLIRIEDHTPSLSVLNGIRTYAILMIIMDHRFGTFLSGPMENFDYIEKEYRSMSSWFLFHGDLFVDTFFILSGILVAYGLLVQFDKKSVHPGYIILLRYVRLTPLYAYVIFFWGTMLAHIGEGPFWKFVIPPEVADCRKNWWANILYISNYLDGDHMCMVHSWYLPCDFHFFVISIFVIQILRKKKKLGLGILLGLFLLSLIIPFLLTVLYLRPGLLQFYPVNLSHPKLVTDFQFSYIKSHTRASTYCIGVFAGYIFYKLKDKEYHIQKVKSHVVLFISIFLLFMGMAPGAIFYNQYHEYNAIEAGAYASLHRAVWGVGTVGLIFAASFGHATLLKNVLSWWLWVPAGKLVYGVYLTHMLFQLRGVAMANAPRHFTYFDMIPLTVSDWVLSFVLSFFLYIMIENPFRKIIKLLLMPERKVSHDDSRTKEEIAEISATYCNTRL